MVSASQSDPFGERSSSLYRRTLRLLGASVRFESNSRDLIRLVDAAYAKLPRPRESIAAAPLKIRLWLTATQSRPDDWRVQPPSLQLLPGAGLLAACSAASNCVVWSPETRSALVVISPHMLAHPYHARYEMIEFAVFTLASRVQKLIPLHAACVGLRGRGIVLMGASGAGKSTVALHSVLSGFEFLSEDSVFISPATMLGHGIANFLHIRAAALRGLQHGAVAAQIRASPVIRRRSGVKKFEVDLRREPFRLAGSPLPIVGVVFLSPRRGGARSLLRPLSRSELRARLTQHQAYAARQPEWHDFMRRAAHLDAFELRRGEHPRQAVAALRTLVTE
jgi:hypothetical protein